MVPRTERFEMRFDAPALERIDTWRAEQHDLPTRSEAVRRLVDKALTESVPPPKELQFTGPEKLMMWMLTEILKHQKGYEEKKTIDLVQDAMYGGHFWALGWELTGVLHDHADDREAVSLVVATLDMWSFIERGFERLNEGEKKRVAEEADPWGTNPRFDGFDGNYESEYMSIAMFLVEKMGRFNLFKGRNFNSHMPVVSRYRHMTRLFEPMRASLIGRDLSADNIIALLKHH